MCSTGSTASRRKARCTNTTTKGPTICPRTSNRCLPARGCQSRSSMAAWRSAPGRAYFLPSTERIRTGAKLPCICSAIDGRFARRRVDQRMIIDLGTRFSFSLPAPIDILLQIAAAHIPEQTVLAARTSVLPDQHFARVAGQDQIGERIWVRGEGRIEVNYSAQVMIERQLFDLGTLAQLEPRMLPGETVQYLLPSLYCPAVRFQPFVEAEFANLQGGACVAAIRDWVAGQFEYTPGCSANLTTA